MDTKTKIESSKSLLVHLIGFSFQVYPPFLLSVGSDQIILMYQSQALKVLYL